MKPGFVFLMLSVCHINTCMAVKFLPLSEHDVPNSAKKITFDEQGNWLEITVNEWKDRIKTDEGVKSYRYQQGYNYQKKQGFIRVYSLNNELISEDYSVEYDGMVAREEMLVAYDLIKNNSTVMTNLKQYDEAIELQGGFNYVENKTGQVCSKGQRCVHVFANTSTKPLVLHAIVRLSDKTVPYPILDQKQIKKR